ncbi:MAG: SMP-30/gluconolactonase/LRE family protein, partial [Acidiferrobacterales bacterium]
PLVRSDGGKFNRMRFDATRKRLLVLDSESGRLYLVDLNNDTPQMHLAAEGLGLPADIGIHPKTAELYIPDIKGKQLWRLKCDDVRCTKPEVFTRADAFRAPRRVAVAPDNTIWVGDLEAQKIFAIGPDGNIQQTISSLAGEQ